MKFQPISTQIDIVFTSLITGVSGICRDLKIMEELKTIIAISLKLRPETNDQFHDKNNYKITIRTS